MCVKRERHFSKRKVKNKLRDNKRVEKQIENAREEVNN